MYVIICFIMRETFTYHSPEQPEVDQIVMLTKEIGRLADTMQSLPGVKFYRRDYAFSSSEVPKNAVYDIYRGGADDEIWTDVNYSQESMRDDGVNEWQEWRSFDSRDDEGVFVTIFENAGFEVSEDSAYSVPVRKIDIASTLGDGDDRGDIYEYMQSAGLSAMIEEPLEVLLIDGDIQFELPSYFENDVEYLDFFVRLMGASLSGEKGSIARVMLEETEKRLVLKEPTAGEPSILEILRYSEDQPQHLQDIADRVQELAAEQTKKNRQHEYVITSSDGRTSVKLDISYSEIVWERESGGSPLPNVSQYVDEDDDERQISDVLFPYEFSMAASGTLGLKVTDHKNDKEYLLLLSASENDETTERNPEDDDADTSLPYRFSAFHESAPMSEEEAFDITLTALNTIILENQTFPNLDNEKLATIRETLMRSTEFDMTIEQKKATLFKTMYGLKRAFEQAPINMPKSMRIDQNILQPDKLVANLAVAQHGYGYKEDSRFTQDLRLFTVIDNAFYLIQSTGDSVNAYSVEVTDRGDDEEFEKMVSTFLEVDQLGAADVVQVFDLMGSGIAHKKLETASTARLIAAMKSALPAQK